MPERWGGYEVGAFAGDYPSDDPRCVYFKGLFQETLHDAIGKITFSKKTVLHIDSDMYNSALFVLTSLAQYLKPGDLIIFDEFSAITHELRAWIDFQDAYKLETKIIGEVDFYHQVALEVLAPIPLLPE
jgi:O-methyltransferase